MIDPYWSGLYLCSARYNLETCLNNLGAAYMRATEQQKESIRDFQQVILLLQGSISKQIQEGKVHDRTN